MSAPIAVVICTWNRAAQLQVTLESLAAVRAPAGVPVEVIVVDNNSNDATSRLLESRRSKWPLGRLTACFEAQQGKQFALNHGISTARNLGCAVLAFTDDDILFPPDWLEQIAAVFGQPDAPSLVGGRTRVVWPNGQIPVWYHASMGAVVGEVDLGPERLRPPPATYAPAGANLVAQLSLFDRIGPFSVQHFRHMDYELGQRAAQLGESIAYEPAVVVDAPVDPGILTPHYFRRWSFKAGLSPWADRNPDEPHLLLVPRWIIRESCSLALSWAWQRIRKAPRAQVFALELNLWRHWGTVSSRWVSRFRPSSYPQGAARKAQKTANLY